MDVVGLVVAAAGQPDASKTKQLNWLTSRKPNIENKRVSSGLATRKLTSEQCEVAVASLPFALALLDVLPAHIVPRALLRSDAFDLLEELAKKNCETPVARASRALKKHLQPIKVATSTL